MGIQDAFRLGEEYTFVQVECIYKSIKENYDVICWNEYGNKNIVGSTAIVIEDSHNISHWFILASASGADYYYKYAFRG